MEVDNEEDPLAAAQRRRQEMQRKRGRLSTLLRQIWKLLRVPIFLLCLAMICTMVRLGINLTISKILSGREDLLGIIENEGLQVIAWIVTGVILLVISVAWTQAVSPLAAGSGIPEIKSTLSGIELEGILSFRTLVAKIFGLVTAMSSGLQMGGEGAFVHVTAIASNLLMKVPIFKFIQNNESLRLKLLSAGCAVGISDNFGAPVGGVLFSVEVTSSFFSVSSLPLNFFCAISGAVMFLVFVTLVSTTEDVNQKAEQAGLDPTLINERHVSALYKVSYLPSIHGWELLLFALLGVLMGTLGAFFVNLNMKIVEFRRKFFHWEKSRYTAPVLIMIVTGVITCPSVIGRFMGLMPRQALETLFSQYLSTSKVGWEEAFSGHQSVSLLFFAISRLFLVAVSFTLPVPSDVYTPSLAIGAALGRGIGVLIGIEESQVGGYAVVGAAAFAAGVTRTMSSAVIIFEMTGQLNYAYPVLVAVLFAYLTGNKLSVSIYDSVSKLRGLPVLGNFQKQKSYLRTVDEIMERELFYLTITPSYLEIEAVLDGAPFSTFPIVHNESDMRLVGTIDRMSLEAALTEQEKYALFRMKGGVENENLHLTEEEMARLEDIQQMEEEEEKRSGPSPLLSPSKLSSTSSPNDDNNSETNGLHFSVNHNNNNNNNEENNNNRSSGRFAAGSARSTPAAGTTPGEEGLDSEREIKRERRKTFRDIAPTASPLRDSGGGGLLGGGGAGGGGGKSKKRSKRERAIEMAQMRLESSERTKAVHDAPKVRAKFFSTRIQLGFSLLDHHPFCISDVTPLRKVHFMFSVLGVDHAFVTNGGRLVGCITKLRLIQDDL